MELTARGTGLFSCSPFLAAQWHGKSPSSQGFKGSACQSSQGTGSIFSAAGATQKKSPYALKFLRIQKCKVYDNDRLIPSEPNKRHRLIHDAIANTVGKFPGA
jgi:hypothetical protein